MKPNGLAFALIALGLAISMPGQTISFFPRALDSGDRSSSPAVWIAVAN